MEVGINTVSALDRSNVLIQSQLVLKEIQSKQASLDSRLAAAKVDAQKFIELGIYDQSEDEGEIMLLAMILLQLNGVKLPSNFEDDLANKKKRQRTSPEQLAILEQIFQTDKMPNQLTRVQLADQLGMSSRRVQIWFQNKRAKVKRGNGSKFDGDSVDYERRNSTSSMSSEPSSPADSSSPSDSPAMASLSGGRQQNIAQVLTSVSNTLAAAAAAASQQSLAPQFSLSPLDPSQSHMMNDFMAPHISSMVAQSSC